MAGISSALTPKTKRMHKETPNSRFASVIIVLMSPDPPSPGGSATKFMEDLMDLQEETTGSGSIVAEVTEDRSV